MNRLIKRQSVTLDRLTSSHGELPNLIFAHSEEVRVSRQRMKQVFKLIYFPPFSYITYYILSMLGNSSKSYRMETLFNEIKWWKASVLLFFLNTSPTTTLNNTNSNKLLVYINNDRNHERVQLYSEEKGYKIKKCSKIYISANNISDQNSIK